MTVQPRPVVPVPRRTPARAVTRGYAAPAQPVAVVHQWTGTYATPAGFGSYPPAAQSMQIPVANLGINGNWLFALCAWRAPSSVQTTVAVGDDSFNSSPGCNLWEPLGAPAGTSPLTGNVVTSVWCCRNALQASNVYVAPTGLVTAMAVTVLEVSGLGPWATLAAIGTGYAGAATAGPSLSASALSAQALMFALLASDNDSYTVTGPGPGWTALTPVTATDGTDHLADCVLTPAWQVTAANVAASWSSSGTQDMAGVLAGVLVTGTPPVAPSQTWPYVQFQAGFSAGAKTPWDQISWTDLTPRYQGVSTQRGKQYELDSIQAGTVNLTLSNNDAALTEGYSGSPYFPNVTVNTPARLLATWPPPPAQNARTYSVWRGYMERWPQQLTSSRYQVTGATGTDVYALLTTLMRSVAKAEILADSPYAYWPLGDPAGAATGANLAKGNSQAIQAVQSKYGAGGATSSFNVAVSALQGDPGCTGWQQASVPAGGTQGWCLYYQDAALPAVSGGVTLEGWFVLNTSQPSFDHVLIAVRNSQGPCLQVRATSAGILTLDVWDRLTQVKTSTTIMASQSVLTGIPIHVAVSFTQAAWTVYVDGGAVRTVSGACNLANTGYWLTSGGIADRLAASSFANVIIAHLAVFGYLVPAARIASHWFAAAAGMYGQDTAGARADRILGDGNSAFPRIMPAGADMFTGALDIGGQAVSQNMVNVAESDSAWLMVNSAGYLAMQDRRGGYDLPAQWTFGELQANPLNSNYQFSGTISPWTAGGGATLSYSTTWAYAAQGAGQGSMLIGPNGTTAGPYAVSELEAVTPGIFYNATAWVYSPQGWSSVQVSIDWYTSGSVYISSATGYATTLNAGVPAELTMNPFVGRAPATAAFAAVSVHMLGTPPASTGMYVGYAALLPPTEYAYLANIQTDCDPSQLYNDITLSQLAAPAVSTTSLQTAVTAAAVTLTVASAAGIVAGGVLILDTGSTSGELVTVSSVNGTTIGITAAAYNHSAGATVTVVPAQGSGITVTAAWQASIASYGDATLQQTNYLTDPNAVTDQAWWITYTTGQPVNRISSMVLDPAANPVLWPVVLGLETGQVVQVNRRLGNGALLEISGLYQVMSVAHQTGARTWQTRVALVPYPGQVLAADDPQYGVPGGSNCIGW